MDITKSGSISEYAIDNFYVDEISEASKDSLQALYTQCQALTQADYTPETWAVLTEKMTAAKTVLDKADASQQEIQQAQDALQAAKDAQAYDFIMSFPDGFDTNLSQGGVNVSGGQKQRLCIARAMLRKPAVLILDDSTSAVDSTTEAAIRASFAKNLKDTTIIMIAQRISSVQYADEILILDDDHIAARGTHEELLKTSPIYQEIYQSQQEGVGG